MAYEVSTPTQLFAPGEGPSAVSNPAFDGALSARSRSPHATTLLFTRSPTLGSVHLHDDGGAPSRYERKRGSNRFNRGPNDCSKASSKGIRLDAHASATLPCKGMLEGGSPQRTEIRPRGIRGATSVTSNMATMTKLSSPCSRYGRALMEQSRRCRREHHGDSLTENPGRRDTSRRPEAPHPRTPFRSPLSAMRS